MNRTTRANMTLHVDYSQIAVFVGGFKDPFNDWEDRHVTQGFAWRPGSVSFRTLEEGGAHLIEVVVSEHAGPIDQGVIRAVEVPFEVPQNGKIEVGSISESVELRIPPGRYLLRSEMFGEVDGIEKIRLVFARAEVGRFAILVADEQILRDVPLLTTARPAI